jgi:hypothetical protein
MGDDNQAFDHPRPGADTAVPMANPAHMQAMYELSKTGSMAYSANPQMVTILLLLSDILLAI